MRDPRRWRAIAIAACLLGGGMAYAPFQLPAGWAGDGLRALLFGVGGTALAFGIVGGWMAHRAARAQAALARGDAVLARWRVDAADWRAFLEADGAAADAGELANELAAGEPPDGGIEIVVGEEAIDVGGSVHVLPRHGAPEVLEATLRDGGGGPDIAELRLRHPPSPRSGGGMSPATYTRLAFPIGRGAWRDARRAIGHYAKGRPGKASFFHGRGDGSDPEDLSTCGACGYRTHQFRATCPECGGGMLSRRWARRYGGVAAVLGLAITLTMTVLLLALSPMLAHPGVEYGSTRFSGNAAQALLVWAVLGAVWVFGATATGLGLSMVATGRRNLRVAWVLAGISGALLLLAGLLY